MENGSLLGAYMWLSNKKQTNPRDAKKIKEYQKNQTVLLIFPY